MITLTSGERKSVMVGLGNLFITIAEMEKDLPNFSYSGPRPSKFRDFVKYATSLEDWITLWRGASSNMMEGGIYTRRAVLASSYNVKTLGGVLDIAVPINRILDFTRRCIDAVYSGPAFPEMLAIGTITSGVLFPKMMMESVSPTSYTFQFFETLTPVWRGDSRVRSYCETCGLPILTVAARCRRCKNA